MFIEISLCGSVQVLSEGGDLYFGGEIEQDLLDCVSQGDCEEACKFVLSVHKPTFNIVAINPSSKKYENRLATGKEMQKVCEIVYFESETNFSDADVAKTYLVWEAASNFQQDIEDSI
tara:strand:- start:1715 stop:2068 length:354 start_codon:yes stop_codon:yes gene_type:complete